MSSRKTHMLLTLLACSALFVQGDDSVCDKHGSTSCLDDELALVLMQTKTQLSLRSNSEQGQTLHAEALSLNEQLQSYASSLAPGATRDFLETLRLCAPCKKFERFGESNDGGYVMCKDNLDLHMAGAYSFGINGVDGWGMGVASRYGVPLNEYDCTNANQPAVCSGCKVNFHLSCISAHNAQSPGANFKTLTQHLEDSGHANAQDNSLLLKIDVESAEWQIFADEPVENLKKFRQIAVEYHDLTNLKQHELYAKAVKKIEEAGFAVAHIHGNNYGGSLIQFGDYAIPNVIEVTYIPKPASGCAADVPYHVPLDSPNNIQAPEVPDAVWPAKAPSKI